MGIRGLTSFISQNADRFHEFIELCDCTLVIDGSSLAYQLYNQVSGCNRAFGGDYDKYAKTIENFFALLEQCNVTPVVIIDGGYEMRKLKTVWNRLKTKMHNARKCNPVNQSTSSVYPLLMMEVFKQVLMKSKVKFAQADFEADFEIAALARYLNCPVLSYDSDYYVFGVMYIPISSLSFVLSRMKTDDSVKYFLNCQLYRIEYFLSNFGGLDKSVLPLMACLLGNDYVPRYMFNKFFKNVKLPKRKKMSNQQKRVTAVFEWLRQETLESAINKILNHLKKGDREFVKEQISLSVASYSHCNSELISHLGLENQNFRCTKFSEGQSKINPLNPHDDIESDDEVSQQSGEESISDCSSDCTESDSDEIPQTESPAVLSSRTFPSWFRDKFRRGEVPTYLADIYHLHMFFCNPQVEDFSRDGSHCLSFSILEIIWGFLFNDLNHQNEQLSEKKDCNLSCYSRGVGVKLLKVSLLPKTSLPCFPSLPPLSSIPSLPRSIRRNILFSSLGVVDEKESDILESFGPRWELFALVVVFWARNAKSPIVNNFHLHAIVICMISLGVVDEKVGRIRHISKVLKKKTEVTSRETRETFDAEPNSSQAYAKIHNIANSIQTLTDSNNGGSLESVLMKVSDSDCLNVVESLLQFFQLDAKLRCRAKLFCPSTVHMFAQLQACLLQASSLNSILDHPVPPCQISEILSGSILYIAFSNFNRRSNVEKYIGSLMNNAPSVHAVYETLLAKFKCLLPSVPVLYRKGKRKSKRKYNTSANNETDTEASDHDTQEDLGEVFDVNNKFSILNLM